MLPTVLRRIKKFAATRCATAGINIEGRGWQKEPNYLNYLCQGRCNIIVITELSTENLEYFESYLTSSLDKQSRKANMLLSLLTDVSLWTLAVHLVPIWNPLGAHLGSNWGSCGAHWRNFAKTECQLN